jgi:hypothetical protein
MIYLSPVQKEHVKRKWLDLEALLTLVCFGLWCLMPPSTIFQLYHGGLIICWTQLEQVKHRPLNVGVDCFSYLSLIFSYFIFQLESFLIKKVLNNKIQNNNIQ